MASIHDEFPIARGFEQWAQDVCDQAEARGEPVYGISPWYCGAGLIEHGAKVAFIGACPSGGVRSQLEDERIGRLRKPYEDLRYNAWLDDRHWEGRGPLHQQRVIETFKTLFGDSQGEDVLRRAACMNVVPVRSGSTSNLRTRTWREGVDWVTHVLQHISPEIIVCNGNGEQKSAWSALNSFGSGLTRVGERSLYNNYALKRGRVDSATVIGLPSLSKVSPARLCSALQGWTFSDSRLCDS